MKCKILHESRGRLRIHVERKYMSLHEADILEYYLKNIDGVMDVKVYDRTGDAVIRYITERSVIITALSRFSYKTNKELVPEHTGRELNRQYQDRLTFTVIGRYACKLFLPAYIRIAIAAVKSVRYLFRGIRSLLKGKIEVALLDAAAITVSMLRKD